MNKKTLSTVALILFAISLYWSVNVIIGISEPSPLAYSLLAIPVLLGIITLLLRAAARREQKAAAIEVARAAEEMRIRRQQEEVRKVEEAARQRELEIQKRQREQEERKRKREELEARHGAYLDAIPSAEIEVSDTPAKNLEFKIVEEIPFTGITSRSTLDSLCDFVALDVETTGLSPSNSEIVEIAAIRFHGFEPVMKFQTLCRPLRGTTIDSEKINGITEEMVEDAPTFPQVAASLKNFIGKDNLVAHNLEFDLKFIVKYGVNVTEEKRKYYDTLRISQRVLRKPDDVINYKLGTLAAFYGIPLFDAHRALADCYAAGALLEALAREKVDL